MIEMNNTFRVGSLFDCNTNYHNGLNVHNTLWKETVLGCYIIQLLQDVYHFNVTYVIQKEIDNITAEISAYNAEKVDIFARPMSLRTDVMKLAYPVHQLVNWDFGFTVFRQEGFVNYKSFYSQPFTRRLWNCLYGMALFCSIFLYTFKLVEVRLLKDLKSWECSFWYELLMVIGGYCQHIPPIDASLCSRRTAYLTFFMFAYVVYTYYTSNLLSHLVNDKDEINAESLMDSDLECLILDDVKHFIWDTIAFQNENNISELNQKVLNLKTVSLKESLKAIKNKSAVMSDYVSLIPFIHSEFNNYEICRLTNIDVITNLKKYFFVSNSFPYKEEFKVALLKLKELGIVNRLKKYYYQPDAECVPVPEVSSPVQFQQILRPMLILIGAYIVCVVILGCEILHYKRTRLWPYVN